MSYGENAPWGLRPIDTGTSASYSGKIRNYYIENEYNTNLFTGDLVRINSNGFLSRWVPGNQSKTNFPTGVFMGCKYTVPTSANPVNPYQSSPMWPGGTTAIGLPGITSADGTMVAGAIAMVIDDPDVLFNIQTNGNPQGAVLENNGQAFGVATGSRGNLITGQSTMVLDLETTAEGENGQPYPLRIRGIVDIPGNAWSTNARPFPFNNVIVSLNNTSFQYGQNSTNVA